MDLGTKFFCTIKDILTSDGEFWLEREFSPENERKFRHLIDILSLFALSYEPLKQVAVGQLVALHYDSSWHRALVVSKSEQTRPPVSARVRLVDYGSSLYVNVVQLKWLPEQFYLFPFKVRCLSVAQLRSEVLLLLLLPGRGMCLQRSSETDLFRHSSSNLQTTGVEQTSPSDGGACRELIPFLF